MVERLTPHLWALILQHVPEDDLRVLFPLCLVSKTLRKAVLSPTLWLPLLASRAAHSLALLEPCRLKFCSQLLRFLPGQRDESRLQTRFDVREVAALLLSASPFRISSLFVCRCIQLPNLLLDAPACATYCNRVAAVPYLRGVWLVDLASGKVLQSFPPGEAHFEENWSGSRVVLFLVQERTIFHVYVASTDDLVFHPVYSRGTAVMYSFFKVRESDAVVVMDREMMLVPLWNQESNAEGVGPAVKRIPLQHSNMIVPGCAFLSSNGIVRLTFLHTKHINAIWISIYAEEGIAVDRTKKLYELKVTLDSSENFRRSFSSLVRRISINGDTATFDLYDKRSCTGTVRTEGPTVICDFDLSQGASFFYNPDYANPSLVRAVSHTEVQISDQSQLAVWELADIYKDEIFPMEELTLASAIYIVATSAHRVQSSSSTSRLQLCRARILLSLFLVWIVFLPFTDKFFALTGTLTAMGAIIAVSPRLGSWILSLDLALFVADFVLGIFATRVAAVRLVLSVQLSLLYGFLLGTGSVIFVPVNKRLTSFAPTSQDSVNDEPAHVQNFMIAAFKSLFVWLTTSIDARADLSQTLLQYLIAIEIFGSSGGYFLSYVRAFGLLVVPPLFVSILQKRFVTSLTMGLGVTLVYYVAMIFVVLVSLFFLPGGRSDTIDGAISFLFDNGPKIWPSPHGRMLLFIVADAGSMAARALSKFQPRLAVALFLAMVAVADVSIWSTHSNIPYLKQVLNWRLF